MSIRASVNRGFTLLEMMIAVMIIAMITLSVYGFVVANLEAIRVTTGFSNERRAVIALVQMLEAELQDLPPRQNNALAGTPHKFNNLPSDEIEWTCEAGNGLFTNAAKGIWKTTLAIQPVEKGAGELEIGLRRRPAAAPVKEYRWLSLIRNVAALEIRYFDPRLNAWQERWTDGNARPLLVRVRVWRSMDDPPYEAVITVPSANLQI